MTIKPLSVVLLGMAILVTAPAYAAVAGDIVVTRASDQEPAGKYIGGAFGNADYDKTGDSDIGFTVYGGILPWKTVGIEFGYVNLGKPKDSAGDPFEVTLFKGGAVAHIPVNINLTVFGQVGIASWDADAGFGPITISDSGTDIYYGFGVENTLTGRSKLRVAVDFYTVGDFDNSGVDEDIMFLSLGLTQTF